MEAGGRGAAAAAGGVEEGTWRLPLTRTLSHTLMRAQGRANAQEKSRGVLLAAAGLPPTTTPTDEPALIAHNVMMKLPAVTHQDGLGKPWLRTPKATPSSPPVTLPTLVTHPLLQSRVVSDIACGPADTYFFSRELWALLAFCRRHALSLSLLALCFILPMDQTLILTSRTHAHTHPVSHTYLFPPQPAL